MNHNHNHNRTFSDSTPRAFSKHLDHHRRLNSDDNLLLFSRSRRSSLDPSDHLTVKLGMISVGSANHSLSSRNGLDDLLASTDTGKHDYDWLLTPPETPLHASSGKTEFHSNLAPSSRLGSENGNRSMSRSGSATKPSRLSTSHLDSNHSSRPARSRSVTRSSVSSTLSSNYSSNRSSSILNTSSASVSSYIRPSSPVTRSSSTSRPSTPSTRTSSRSSTPSKARSAPSITSTDRTRPSSNSRPSTPSSRPQIPANLSFPTTRSNSRPSTPTRRNSISTPSAPPSISVASGRVLSNGRSHTSTSRPSSPSPRIRPQQPVIPPDFPLDTPPNLRTTLSDRAVSAGRSRPGASLTSKVNMENPSSVNLPRRTSSPVVARGRSVEPQGRGHLHTNGHHADVSEPRRSTYVTDSVRKPVKTSPTSEGGGFGRTISKKSLDMAIRHMDIRNGSGTTRPLASTSLFPQSVRSVPSKIQTMNGCSSPSSSNSNGSPSISNNGSFESGIYSKGPLENGKKEENGRLFGRLGDVDMFESSRYDAILLKEDLRNTTWLHSVDDKSDQCSIFDGGFESLPEPFGLL